MPGQNMKKDILVCQGKEQTLPKEWDSISESTKVLVELGQGPIHIRLTQ